MKNAMVFSSLLLLSFLTMSFSIHPNTTISKWERLGSKKVNFKLEKDVIHVNVKEGRYSKLKVQVTGGDLNMHKMLVEYRNGEKETINIRHNFNAKSGSRVIDINGHKRFIKDITFWYDSVNKPGRKATVHVLARK